MNWIQEPLRLEGKHVVLRPLAIADHAALSQVAADPRIWEFMSMSGEDPDRLEAILTEALQKRESGEQYPFVVEDRRSGKLIGSTRYLDISQQHLKLEIGWTWMSPSVWGTGINYECKYLLLQHAFEQLQCRRVQLVTSHLNIRSRTAIARIGGVFEGILRKERLRQDGSSRNTVYFSILDEEWPEVKKMLLTKIPG